MKSKVRILESKNLLIYFHKRLKNLPKIIVYEMHCNVIVININK